MKKVFFLMKYTTVFKESLLQKFDGQMEGMKNLGYEVWYIEWDGEKFYLVNWNSKYRKLIRAVKCFNKEQYFHTFYFIDLYKLAKKVINKNGFTYVYMRRMPVFLSTISMANMVKKIGTKLIVEIPTYNYKNEQKKEKRILRKIATKISEHIWNKLNDKIDLYSIIGREESGDYLGRPAVNISNGIVVDRIKPKCTLPYDGNHLELIAVASMCYWHGYDRLIKAISEYTGNVKVRLHLVGPDGDGSLIQWKGLVKKLNLEKSVVIHGPMYGEQLDNLFDRCHLGIGSLGLYREKMEVGAILKNREYMARGIPFVYAGRDYNIELDFPYALQLENADSPIDIKNIVEFATRVLNNDKITYKMRNYANKNMSWESELRKVLEAAEK